ERTRSRPSTVARLHQTTRATRAPSSQASSSNDSTLTTGMPITSPQLRNLGLVFDTRGDAATGPGSDAAPDRGLERRQRGRPAPARGRRLRRPAPEPRLRLPAPRARPAAG